MAMAYAVAVKSSNAVLEQASTRCIATVSQQRQSHVSGYSEPRGNSGVRARTKAQSSMYISSSRLTRCLMRPSNSRNLARGLAGNVHQKLTWNGKSSNSGTHLLWEHVNHGSQQRTRGVVSASLAGPGTVEVAANLFQLATAFVVPFYTVMILAPKWEWTKKLMESELAYFFLGAGYIYLLCLSWTPKTLGLMFSSKYWLPELGGITQMFASTLTVASAWIHLLAADLFAGRQVFLDGVKHNIETRHSLVLCLMMCPIGIFSHLVTKSVIMFMRRTRKQGKGEITNDCLPYSNL